MYFSPSDPEKGHRNANMKAFFSGCRSPGRSHPYIYMIFAHMSNNKRGIMKVCITAQGPYLKSAFEPHFARAPYFIFYDTRTGKLDAVRNGFVVSNTRIGQNAVRLLKMNGLEAVITGEIGENAGDLLKSAGIPVHIFTGTGTVKDALGYTATE